MAPAKEAFVHEEEDDDGDHPVRYLPIRHVYSSSEPCINPSGSSSVMSKKVKARKPSDEEFDDEACGGKSLGSAKKPFLVYCRRGKRPRFDSSEEKVEKSSSCFGGAEENAIDRPDGGRSDLDADSITGKKIANKRTVMKYELLRLGVGDSALDGSTAPRLRAFQGIRTPKPSVTSMQVHVGVRKNSSASSKMKRWVELDFEGADPELLIGLACKVYWPMDDEWYKGLVSGYNSSTTEHKIEYKDGEVEHLVLSKEKMKFHISAKEMQQLNLKCGIPYTDKGLNYNELLSLAVNFHECQDFETGDLVWAKLTGHAMWPAVVLQESEFCSNKGLKPGRPDTILVQFFGTHDFARIKLKQAIPFLNGLLSSLHQKCKQARFYQSLDEAKLYLKDQQLSKSMLELQRKIDTHDFRALSDGEIGSGDDASADEMANAVNLVEMSPIEIGDLRLTSLGAIELFA